MKYIHNNTIIALATPKGEGAIAVIRLSGNEAINIVDKIFEARKKLSDQKSHTLHFGKIVFENKIIDEVVVSLYKSPHSYTGENVVEISCHGSQYIIQQIIEICVKLGAQYAKPGEFTQRAFLNGKLDLSQAESVAEIIASENSMQLEMAFSHMRGGYSTMLENMRNELIEFAALIELELDFSEEDVEFADREKFIKLLETLHKNILQLINSFALGNVLKNGIEVVIVGEPNVGKSTLLNQLLQEQKAIVSDIAGTTRDFIEDTMTIDGFLFRFIDTAGIRQTEDTLEAMGIERSFEKMKSAKIILYLTDINIDYKTIVDSFQKLPIQTNQQVIILLNKSDKMVSCNAYDIEEAVSTLTHQKTIEISAHTGRNIDILKQTLSNIVHQQKMQHNGLFVSNTRHLHALQETLIYIEKIQEGIQNNLSGELLAIDIKMALHSLGKITGVVEIDRDILGTIFGKFCIGK